MSLGFAFDNSYARLPERFHVRLDPTPVRAPELLRLNESLAGTLGLNPEALKSTEGVAVLAGNLVPEGAEPLAMAYAGHQFGNFVPQLGDGRALLLGEVRDREGVRRDIQLKGSGPTPFSRMGDGRAALGPVIREYIISEAMAALGIPTTRALAMVATGEKVYRESAEPGGILTRVARGHVRIGTFEYFAHRNDTEAVRVLGEYVMQRHAPHLLEAEKPWLGLLEYMAERSAHLIADWMLVGFIHGVMNTDNLSLSGETIDYGPCAFMDNYHPETCYSYVDSGRRYAYGRQPRIGQWNLARFAETLLPLLDEDRNEAVEQAEAALETYSRCFEKRFEQGLARKIGLPEALDEDTGLAWDLLERMAEHNADFTLTFRRLRLAADANAAPTEEIRQLFADPQSFDEWASSWQQRLAQDGRDPEQRKQDMDQVNPAMIPRNHRVEQAIQAAREHGDLEPTHRLLAAVTNPYREQPEHRDLMQPPTPEEVVRNTFCGT